MKKEPYVVEKSDDGQRLDRLLMRLLPEIPFSSIQKACRKGEIRVNSGRVKGREKIKAGDLLRLPPYMTVTEGKLPEFPAVQLKKLAENILYEDENLVVINKPAGTPSQAGSGHEISMDRLLVSLAKNAYSPKLLHRLDKQTSGCLAFAKNRGAAALMGEKFKSREMKKTYLAIVHGNLPEKSGTIKLPLSKGEGAKGREKMCINPQGQPAVTHYKILNSKGNYHLVEAMPETGRMHQIRVHLAENGAPIVGDGKYGGISFEGQKNKLFLHAHQLNLTTLEEKNIKITAPLPAHFNEVINKLDFKCMNR